VRLVPLKIIRNDITKVSADAIVNTANPKPIYASGTDQAIYEAAGADQLLAERKKIGDIARGGVAVTAAFHLPAKYILHTVGPVWQDGKHHEFEILHDCYSNSLQKAAELSCESVAFPLIATGVYGFPKDKALQIAISVISDFLMQCEMLVYLVVFDEKSFQLSGQVIGTVQSFIDANYVATRRETEYRGSRTRRGMEAEAFDASDLEEHEARYMKAQEREEASESTLLSGTICSNVSLDDQFAHMGGTFQEKLFEMIEYRGLTNVEVYTRANLDRKHFSKIQCNVNYHPSKKTAMALCIALKLDLEESRDLLARAEWAFSPNRKLDLIVMNAIVNHEYNINQVNAILFEYGQECLGI
jgi:O-acetyl-ADP-ribose deacetylase (regulator of RNase III)